MNFRVSELPTYVMRLGNPVTILKNARGPNEWLFGCIAMTGYPFALAQLLYPTTNEDLIKIKLAGGVVTALATYAATAWWNLHYNHDEIFK